MWRRQQATTIVVDGTTFPLVSNVNKFVDAIAAGRRAAYRLRPTDYRVMVQDAGRRINDRYGESSPQAKEMSGALVYCAGCLWELPGSYQLSLLDPTGFGGMLGSGGSSVRRPSGQCTRCGSPDILFVYECIPPSDIAEPDIQAIRDYWHALARRWWEQTGRSRANCYRCSRSLSPGKGYLHGSDIKCKACADDNFAGDAVSKLQQNPHYFGWGPCAKRGRMPIRPGRDRACRRQTRIVRSTRDKPIPGATPTDCWTNCT